MKIREKINFYYDIEPILKIDAQYRIVYGQRSNGKTYAVLLRFLRKYWESGCRETMGIIRRYDTDFSKKEANAYFGGHVKNGKGKNEIAIITNHEWDGIEYRAGAWYLTKYDDQLEKTVRKEEPFAYAFALNNEERYKGGQYPSIKMIVLDEAIARSGRYLPDEFVVFMNLLSTIIRDRGDVEIWMLGNTISKYCPYFNEMGLKKIGKQKQGTIDIYNYGSSELKVAVEYAPQVIATKRTSSLYFAFDNPKLKMITGGEWEFDIYPHLPEKFHKYKQKNIVFRYFIIFDA